MAEEYYLTEVSTWTVNNKGQKEFQDIAKKLEHVKVMGRDLEGFVSMIDTTVDDINYKYPKCKAMISACSKMMGGLILLNVRAGEKDIASMKLYPIRNTWKEDTK